MKKSIITLYVITLLSFLAACVSNNSTQDTSSDEDKVATIVAGTLSSIPSPSPMPIETLMPTLTNTPVVDEWTWHNIDLYSLKLKLPSGWTISEVNRRPEPAGIENSITGHDCAEYQLISADKLSVLSLRPTCGFAEGLPGSCPSDTVIINRQQEKFDIGRYFTNGKFVYANAYLLTYSDLTGDHQEIACVSPPRVGFTKVDGFTMADIDFQYVGNETNIDQILTEVNEIILSISEQ